MKAQFIAAEYEVLVSTARQPALNLRANPIVLFLDSIHEQVDARIDLRPLLIVARKARVDVILDSARSFWCRSGQKLRHHSAAFPDSERDIGENRADQCDAFLGLPLL